MSFVPKYQETPHSWFDYKKKKCVTLFHSAGCCRQMWAIQGREHPSVLEHNFAHGTEKLSDFVWHLTIPSFSALFAYVILFLLNSSLKTFGREYKWIIPVHRLTQKLKTLFSYFLKKKTTILASKLASQYKLWMFYNVYLKPVFFEATRQQPWFLQPISSPSAFQVYLILRNLS